MKKFDQVIIGAGIVGLASAYKLIKKDSSRKILVLDKEAGLAQHQTGRNSGVIHSGLYYKPGSYKAKLCISGYKEIITFAEEFEVPYKICGKLVVANGVDEESRLMILKGRGEANGLNGIKVLSSEEAREKEPYVRASKALWVPQTGVIDYVKVCQALSRFIQSKGARVEFGQRVVSLETDRSKLAEVRTELETFYCSQVINCAGLHSDKVVELDSDRKNDIKILPFRGEYYDLTPEASSKVKGLIYPVPDPAFPFLGVHLTRGVAGHVEAGPNAVLAFAREGYRWTDIQLDELFETLSWPGFQRLAIKHWDKALGEYWRSLSKPAFLASLQQLMPTLMLEDLVPGGTGVRAQASSKSSELLDDFSFYRSNRALHVLNAPSPAATSSLAIAGEIVQQLEQLKR